MWPSAYARDSTIPGGSPATGAKGRFSGETPRSDRLQRRTLSGQRGDQGAAPHQLKHRTRGPGDPRSVSVTRSVSRRGVRLEEVNPRQGKVAFPNNVVGAVHRR